MQAGFIDNIKKVQQSISERMMCALQVDTTREGERETRLRTVTRSTTYIKEQREIMQLNYRNVGEKYEKRSVCECEQRVCAAAVDDETVPTSNAPRMRP